MTVKTQGTQIWFVSTLGTDRLLVLLNAATAISGLGGPAGQIDTTDLSALVDKTFVRGLGVPASVSVPFNLNPGDVSQADLFLLKTQGNVLTWLIGLSESADTPTLHPDLTFTMPATRSWIEFTGYISDVTIDIATDQIVKGTLAVQRSGAVTYTPL